jgi:hypothetical protein
VSEGSQLEPLIGAVTVTGEKFFPGTGRTGLNRPVRRVAWEVVQDLLTCAQVAAKLGLSPARWTTGVPKGKVRSM